MSPQDQPSPPRRVYLDQAATSFPKPESVYQAVDRYNRQNGAAIGRGAYRSSVEAGSIVEQCRHNLARLVGAERADRLVFTFNGTDSLNLALHGLLQPGDHVVTSQIEHNSVLRPLRALQDSLGIEVTRVAVGASGRVEPADFRRALQPNTKLLALIHASNVSGVVQPIAEVGEIARSAGILILVDAAQTVGHLPIDLGRLPVDLLAAPGHKGLLGPLGTGFLYVRPGVEEFLKSVRQGGTGTVSEYDMQPTNLPEKYESGNHNAPGLVGLEASVTWIAQQDVDAIQRHEHVLLQRLCVGIRSIPGVRLYCDDVTLSRVGVCSLTMENLEPQTVAAILDQSFGIEVRAGLHCSPGAHRALGTFDSGGTVRLSVGALTTMTEIDAAIAAIRQIAESV